MPSPSKIRVNRAAHVTVSFSDSINLIQDQIHWSPKGVCLLTKWFFEQGTEVEFAFDHRGERHCCTGVVVACHPLRQPRGHFETVLYFVDTPCSKLQKAACACRLARESNIPPAEANFIADEPVLDGALRSSSRLRSR
jgi:hypothetical protein